jgi:pyruvate formate lyase activating enzyme
VVNPQPPFLNEETVLKILEERRKYVDAVVVTGGEPTIHKELPKFLKKLKDRGFAVKLDTNGLDSHMLEECLQSVDYVALDVKTSLEKYELLGVRDTAELVRTVDILKMGKVDYEFRTTVVPGFFEPADVSAMSSLVNGARAWALQQFVPGDTLDKSLNALKPYDPETLSKYAEAIRNCAEEIILRA